MVVSPLLLPILLVYFEPYQITSINIALALLFLLFSITDLLDGFLARKYHQVTRLGALLDPIADKFLLYSVLIALVAIQKLFFFWAIIFIGREFFIMGLRIIALNYAFSVPVNKLGKFKTVLQGCYVVLAVTNSPLLSSQYDLLSVAENFCLVSALFFSLISAYIYYRSFMKQFLVIQHA